MMKKSQTTPRKTPKQERSVSLVESILTASTRVFSKLNYNKTTTNKIAQVAGVSIGSLYQYFPGKDAIVRSLIHERIETQLEVLEKILYESRNETLPQTIERVIRMIAEPAYKNKSISRLFYGIGMFLGASAVVLESRKRAVEIIFESLNQRTELNSEKLRIRLSILLNAILGSIASAVIDPTEQVALDDLVSELKSMALAYLTR